MSCLQFLFLGGDDNHHTLAFELGHLFKLAGLLARLCELEEHQLTLILIDDGTALEEHLHFHLAAFFQEADGMVGLELEVVLVGLRSEADFLDDHLCRLGFDVLLFLLLFVKKLLVVHYLAHGRGGLGGDFHQVETELVGERQSLTEGDDFRLKILTDDPHGRCRNELIYLMRVLFFLGTSATDAASVGLCCDCNLLFLTDLYYFTILKFKRAKVQYFFKPLESQVNIFSKKLKKQKNITEVRGLSHFFVLLPPDFKGRDGRVVEGARLESV